MRPWVLGTAALACVPVSPASASDKINSGPVPAWVHSQGIPAAKPGEAPVALLLHDEQVSLQPGKISSFRETAFKIQTAEGLSAGNLSIVWEPELETVTVHKLHILRGDKVIDVLGAGQTFTILRRETNLDAATLDGSLTATIQPEGLQEGDVVDLAVTVDRADPVMKGHVESTFAAWGGVPITLAHASVQWPGSVKLNIRESSELPPVQRSSIKGVNLIEMSGHDVQPLIAPKGAPLRFRIGRLAEASDYASWADVADLMLPLYKAAAVVPPSGPLHDEVEKIRAASSDPLVRATQALALVQNRVRYVALLMGQGGYVPASAEQTWSRRFGDCKAKTSLLLAVLQSLGIQGEPVMVGVKVGDAIADRLPSVGMFNHVLVRAHIRGRDYWLDGTRTGDTDLNGIQTPDFGWGLPLVQHASLFHLVPSPLAQPEVEHRVDIDASGGVYGEAPITFDEIYRGDTAVDLNTEYAQLTAAQRDQALHDKIKNYFDGFTITGSSVKFDKVKRELDVTIKGTAKLSWKDNWLYVPTSSISFDPDFDRPAGPLHDVPLAVNHPRFVKDRATLHLPPGFAAAQKLQAPVHETLAGVEYSRSESIVGTDLVVDSSERSITEEVPYKEAVAAVARLRKLNKDDVYLTDRVGYGPSAKDLKALAEATPSTADEYVSRAELYLNGGDYDRAIADFSAALKIDPDNKWARGDRGIAAVWKQDFDKAEADFAAVAAKDPTNSVVSRGRALIAEMKGDCSKAVTLYTRSLAQEAGNNFALEHRARCEADLSKYAEALADSAEVLKSSPNTVDLRRTRATIFKRQNNRNAAIAEAELSSSQNPSSVYAQVVAALIYSGLGMRTEAMGAYDRALAIKPAVYVYISRAGSRSFADTAGRMADFDAALKLEPDNGGVLTSKAYYLALSGDYSGALALYDKASASEDSIEFKANRAVALLKAGRTSDARKAFDAAHAQAKTGVDFNDLCWIKATAGVELESAVAECRQAIKLNPGSGPFADSLGMALLRQGKLDEALAAYNEAVAKDTGADSLMGRAFVYLRKGDRVNADADAAAARKLSADIDDVFASYGLKFDAPPPPMAAAETRH